MPLSSYLTPVALLIGSNVFMTTAWYWHLRYKEVPLLSVILISWGLAFVRILPGGAGQSLRQRGLFGGAAQDHAGGDHALRVRGLLDGLSQASRSPGTRASASR